MTDQFERTPDLRGMPDRPADYGHPMAMAEALLAQQSPLCWNCNHGLDQHAIQNERSATACNRCRCSEFRQPPIHPEPEEGDRDVEAPRTVPSSRLFAGAFEHLASDVEPLRVSLHTGEHTPPDYDRQAFETISRNMAGSIDAAAMERLARPSRIESVPAEESRRPLVFRATGPVTDEEGQGLANRVREMTSYPVVVVDQRWEVIA
ncbi:MAG: hypothetical protein AB7L91_16015 [Dehalococcoidia bacterium]